MSYSKSNKIKLLQSASALILGATAVTAHAQSVSTTATDVTVANTVDALVVVDQSVSASSGTTATANTIPMRRSSSPRMIASAPGAAALHATGGSVRRLVAECC